ncbi:MAG: DUF4132 domain-containing protein, partial [Myxococcota bacterium]
VAIDVLDEGSDPADHLDTVVRVLFQDIDCYKLCRRLLAAVDDESDEVWPLYIQAIVGSPFQIRKLAQYLEGKSTQELEVEPWTELDIVALLKRERSPEAMGWLNHLSQNSQRPKIARACRQALQEMADLQFTSIEELLRGDLPELYLNPDGERRFNYGPRTILAQLQPDLGLRLQEEGGRIYSSTPPIRKSDHPEQAEQARSELKQFIHHIKMCVNVQGELLESAMIHGRRWPMALWRERFLIHPIMKLLSRGLVFVAYSPGQPIVPFCLVDRQFLTLEGEPARLGGDSTVGIVHPAQLSAAKRSQWTTHIRNVAPCSPPFAQFNRPIHDLEAYQKLWYDPEGELGAIALHHLRSAKRKSPYKGSLRKGTLSQLTRTMGPYRARIDFSLGSGQEEFVVIDSATCVRVEVSKGKHPVPPEHLPPAVFSEVTRDLLHFAG